ncbi:TonB-dependent receptor [Agarivorans sp. Toyoura001]|uniref:TonB-dependent receptor plug domain-containing protein n=1 Tax=Agarivorans sp. Toyoura001 TaxID=2283141 RepID=UPI0010DF5D55|nr:TonB-dependent receptor [Agarivorans sp. Toyoura001]GDY25930.1 TonB-dependent receptor [Agarivorans sp. Toyoura001]
MLKPSTSACFLLFCASSLVAEENNPLSSLELESLMATDVQATSAMKRAQSAFTTAASLYVLSKEDIKASGAVTVAESLKLVPGLEVRQLDNNQWAITARSVAGRYTSKLLVMVDGQSVYNPAFAGVYWETLDVPLYDIERIEVIRGQGGLLWGSNATNGVINIITKSSLDTRDTLVQVSSGDQLNYDVGLRHGGDLGNNGSYRVYGSVRDSDASKHGTKAEPNDDAKQKSIGFRLDFAPNDDLSILTQLNYTHTDMGQNLKALSVETNQNTLHQDRFQRQDGRVMARAEHRMSNSSNQMLQASWAIQDGEQLYLDERFQSLDIDYQMNTLFGRTQFDWGLNYRNSDLPFEENALISSDADLSRLQHYGAFVQAQFPLVPETLNLIVGNKSEHNSFTGWEHQPVARLLWQPSNNHVVWGAVSQGVRIPSLAEYDYDSALNGTRVGEFIQTGIDAIDQYHLRTVLNGNQQVEPEKSLSYELGYRFSQSNWSLDVALFHTQSKDVFAVQPNTSPEGVDEIFALLAAGKYQEAQQALTETVVEFDVVSNAELNVKGGEALIAWQPNPRFTSELGYSQMSYRYNLQPDTQPAIGYDSDSKQLFAKAGWQVFKQHSLFALFRSINSDAYRVDDYDVLDLSWNWQFKPSTQLSLSGKNLLAGSHVEYNNTSETFTVPNYIEPSVVIRLMAEF